MVIGLLRIFAIVCTAFICGKLISRIKLPVILGWLIAGIVYCERISYQRPCYQNLDSACSD